MRTAQLCQEFGLQVRYTVYPLHPDTPDAGMTLEELFAGRFDIDAMLARLRQVAAELDLPFGDRTHTYNSRRAQELGKWAEQQGGGSAFQDATYRAYFVDGKNIAQVDVLAAIAAGVGLDTAEAERVLTEKCYSAAVDTDWQRARSMAITAVPTLLYDHRQLVGYAPYEDFQKLVTG